MGAGADGAGLADVGDGAGRDVVGDGRAELGVGLGRRVLRDGLGERVGPGDDAWVAAGEVVPVDSWVGGRTTTQRASTARNSTVSTTVEVRSRPICPLTRRLRSSGRCRGAAKEHPMRNRTAAYAFAVSVFATSSSLHLLFLIFPVLVWAAVRFQQHGATVCTLIVSGACGGPATPSSSHSPSGVAGHGSTTATVWPS